MFTYENGLIVAALLYVYYLFNLVITINSTAERNLNKVGERHSWLTLRPKPMEAPDFVSTLHKKIIKFLVVALFQGLFVFLGWVGVLINIVLTFYYLAKDYGAPATIKEFRWKIRNVDLEFDEIIREFIKVRGLRSEEFDKVKEEMTAVINQRRGA